MDQNQAIAAFIEEKKEEMLALWKELVNLESYVGEADHVTAVLRRVQQELEAEGFDCRLVEVGGGWAGTLVGTLGADRPGKPILFSGHLDTVFPAGSWGPAPFRIEDGKAYGPGALDMKGGVVIALYVAKALNHIGYRQTPIKVIFSGNEEKGHVGSTGDQVFLEEARGCQFAFNMETGLHTGELCVGRKGHLGCHVEVTGIESHAGNDFESGRSAIEEAAHKILAIQALTDLEEGTTVNVGVIQGGTVPNAVPGSCRFEVDIRVAKEEGRSRIKRMLPPIVEHCTVPGTSATYAFDGDSPIYETTEKVEAFYDFCCQVAKDHGFPVPGRRVLGGFSDAAYVMLAGTPVICSFGVQGQWNHTKREYALVDTLFQRANYIAAIVLDHEKFQG